MRKGLILLLGTSIISCSALCHDSSAGLFDRFLSKEQESGDSGTNVSQKILDMERDIQEFRTEEIEPRYTVKEYYERLTGLRKDAEGQRYDGLSDKIIQLENQARKLKTEPAKTLIQDIERLKKDIMSELEQQAETFFSKENFTGAKSKFEEALDYNPFDSNLRNKLGNTYLRLKDKNNAITQFRDAVKQSPNTGLYHHNLGYALAWMRPNQATKQQVDEAIQEVYKAIELNPKLECAYNFLRGLLYDRSGKKVTKEIMDLQKNWLKECPNSSDGHMHMATSLCDSNPATAIIHYKKVVELAPHYILGHVNYIWACRNAKRYEDMLEAAKGFEEAAKTHGSGRYDSKIYVGEALYHLGREREAWPYLKLYENNKSNYRERIWAMNLRKKYGFKD